MTPKPVPKDYKEIGNKLKLPKFKASELEVQPTFNPETPDNF